MIGIFAITTIVWAGTFTYAQAKPQIPVRNPHAPVRAVRSVVATKLGNTVTDSTSLARSVPEFSSLIGMEASAAKTEQNSTCRVGKTPAVMTQP